MSSPTTFSASATLNFNGTNWIVTDGANQTTLNTNQVTLGTVTYLLVDQASAGGYSTIQSAVDAATSGEVVVIAQGTYNENVHISTAHGGITIENATGNQVVIDSQGGYQGAITIDQNAFATIQGDAPANFVLNAAAGSNTFGLYLVGNNDTSTISHITVNANGENAVLTGGSEDNVTFDGNVFGGTATQLVYVNGAESLGHAAQGGNIDFTNNTFQGTFGLGLGIEAKNGTVSGNTFAGSGGTAVGLAEDGYSISGNNFTGSYSQYVGVPDNTYNTSTILSSNSFPNGEVTIEGKAGVYGSIQAAIDAASTGDIIHVGPGTYNENLNIDKGVIIEGANHGLVGTDPSRGAETIITGQSTINTTDQVTIDGVEFLDNKPLTSLSSSDTFVSLTVLQQASTATGHIIENSVFDRAPMNPITAPGFDSNTFEGSSHQPTHRGIEIASVGTGQAITIQNNLITGENSYTYAGDDYRSGIYSNGGTGSTFIENNTFSNVRSGINADNFSSHVQISGNSFDHDGSGVSVGVGSDVANVTSVTNNTFDNVDNEFNFKNLTTPVTFNAGATGNSTSNPSDPFYIEGSSTGGDHITGTSGADILVGHGTGDILIGGAGNDTIVGGTGTNSAAAFSGTPSQYDLSGLSFSNGLASGTISGPDGSDTLSGVAALKFGNTYYVLPGMSIQAAINDAANGDTIEIAQGTYIEQLLVNGKNLTIHGDGIVTIQAPATLVPSFTVSASGTPQKYAIIGVENHANVTIDNVHIDGQGAGDQVGGGDFNGVYYFNSSGHLENSVISGIRDGGPGGTLDGDQRGVAIGAFVTDGSSQNLEIDHNNIYDFQKNGMALNGQGLTVEVHDNSVTGAGASNDIAQNGIQVSFGAGGSVTNNVVSGIGYTPDTYVGTGILVYGAASGVHVDGNTVTGVTGPGDAGIYFFDSDAPEAHNNQLSGLETALAQDGSFTTAIDQAGNTFTNDTANLSFIANDGITSGPYTIHGTSGNDVLDGSNAPGADVVTYTGTLTASDFSYDPVQNIWTVNATAGGEGTDQLQSVEKVTDGANHTFLLVDPQGSYTTIQAAINAAHAGDTVVIGAGTYHENITLKDGVNVVGVDEANVVIDGSVATPATMTGTTIGGFTINNADATSMLLDMTHTTDLTDVVFNNINISLTSDFTGAVAIGNGQVSGTINLHDADNDGKGLTFQNVTIDGNNHDLSSTSLVYTMVDSIGGAEMLLNNVSLSGVNGSGIGTQWNMTPQDSTTQHAAVEIENSQTSNGGNFYVSGFDNVSIHDNTFTNQGVALNGVNNADVTNNIFQHIDGSITANGTQHRGLTIEDAWGTHGDANITVTGNTFQDITAADGAIAFQRFTDNGSGDLATFARLHGITIDDNTFSNVAHDVFVNGTSFGPGAVIPSNFDGVQVFIGTFGTDSLTGTPAAEVFAGGAGDDTIHGNGGGDVATYATTLSNASFSVSNGHWVINAGADGFDNVDGVAAVVDGTGHRFLLVGEGGYATIQDAINAASDGDTIEIAAGTYTEQLSITGKNINLNGVGAVTVKAPAVMDVSFIVPPAAEPYKYAVIGVQNGNVDISNLSVDGADGGNQTDPAGQAGAGDYNGIYYFNAAGHVSDVNVTGIEDSPLSGVQRGSAIVGYVTDGVDRSFVVSDSTVSSFQKNGIVFAGDHMHGDAHGNTITGAGPTSLIAQNGVEVLFGADGTVHDNVISGIGWTPATDVGTGVLVYDAGSGVTVDHNQITGVAGPGDAGIYFHDSDAPEASFNTLTNLQQALTQDGSFTTELNQHDNTFINDDANVTIDASSNSGAFTFTGTPGNDIITGTGGLKDVVSYTETLTASDFSYDSVHNTWIVTTANEGTDTLSGIEKVTDGTHTFLLVDPHGSFTTIQAAVDAASSGDTILIGSGTYKEQVLINGKNVTLEGVGNVTVQSPDSASLVASFNAFGQDKYAVIGVENASNVTIDNITVDGLGQGNQPGAAGGDFEGIAYLNASGHVTNSIITGVIDTPFDGAQHGNALAAFVTDHSAQTLEVANNTIEDFQKNGMKLSGDGLTVNVHDNHVTGLGATGTIAQNGIELINGAGGSVIHNDVSDIGYSPASDVGTGILVYQAASGVQVDNNTVTGVSGPGDSGIDFFSSDAPEASGNILTGLQQGLTQDGTFTTVINQSGNTFTNDDANLTFDAHAGGPSSFTIQGTSGNDVFSGNSGGTNTDVVHYTGTLTASAFSYDSVHNVWTVNAGAEGTDQMSGVEQVTDGAGHHFLLVDPNGSYTTIQAAIDAANPGDTILIGDGTYNESITVNKANLTIEAVGSNAVIQGTFNSDNGVTGSLATWLQTAPGYHGTATSTDGITISANGSTISGLKVQGFIHGVNFSGADVDSTTLSGLNISDTVIGIEKTSTNGVSNLAITGGSISDGYNGIEFDKGFASPAQASIGNADHVLIDGTSFSNLDQKGIYVETLSNAHITNVTMNDVGQFGGVPSFGVHGNGGNGIDLNLKNGTYSNLEIDHFTLTNTGTSNGGVVGADGQQNGGAIVVEARDAGSYLNAPATITGIVSIHDGSIDGTSTGIQIGEPNQANTHGPNVDITNVDITNAQHSIDHGDIANVASTSTTTITLDPAGQTLVMSPTTTGAVIINDSAGNDSVTGGPEHDTVHYTGTLTASDFSYDSVTNTWTVNAGAEGTDTLKGVEQVTDASHHFLLVDPQGSYTSIQAAIDAANPGDIILVGAGTYNESVNLNKDVTLVGANHGIDGHDPRGAESLITGGIHVTADGATIDGFEVQGTVPFGDLPNGIYVESNNVTIINSVLDGQNNDVRPFSTQAGVSGFDFEHNQVKNWGEGAYIVEGDSGTIAHNHFTHNGNDILTESVSMIISANDFENSAAGSHVAALPFAPTVDVSSFIKSDNTFSSDLPYDVAIYPNAPGAQTITGTDFSDKIKGPDNPNGDVGLSPGPLTINGGNGDDIIYASSGNDDITGGGGNDTIVAGPGTDTVEYSGNRSDYVFVQAPDGTVYVSDSRPGAPDGFDTLTGVELFHFADGTFTLADVLDHPPTAAPDAFSATEDVTLATGNVLTNDTDPDSPPDTLSVSAVNGVAGNVGHAVTGIYGTLTLNSDGTFSYLANTALAEALAQGAHGTDTFSYTTTDSHGKSATTNVVFNVTGTNDAPTVDTTHSVTGTSFSEIGGITGSGQNRSQSGSVFFTDVDSTDSLTMDPLSAATIVWKNASNVDISNQLTAAEITALSNLTATLGGSGNAVHADWTYNVTEKNLDFLGVGETLTISKTVTIHDGNGGTVTQPITVTIHGADDAPTTVNDTVTDTEDGTVVSGASLLANDSDPDTNDAGTLRVSAATSNGTGNSQTFATLGDSHVITGAFGDLTLNGDGTYSYNANHAEFLAVGQTVTDNFTVTVTDNHGASSLTRNELLSVTVTGQNDPPVANDDFKPVNENGVVSGSVLANDFDPDNGDHLSVATIDNGNGPQAVAPGGSVTLNGQHGTLTINSDGSYVYTETDQTLAQGVVATDTFHYEAADNHGGSSIATLNISVTGVNEAPVAVADTASATEDTNTVAQPNPVTGNVLTNDTDVDVGDTHSVTAVNGLAVNVGHDVVGTYGTLHLNSDGSYTYTLNNALPAVQALAEGQQVTDTFTYTNTDNNGGSSGTTLTVTVTGTDDAPVAVADSASVKEDTNTGQQPNPVTGNVLTNDTDVDTGDTRTVHDVNGLTGNVGHDVVGTYGTLHLNSDGSYTYTLNNALPAVQALAEGQQVTDTFTYNDVDNHGAVSQTPANLVITVTGTNDAPVAVADTGSIHEDDVSTSGNVLTNDTDVDTLDTHTVATVNGSAANVDNDVVGTYGTLHLNHDGTYTYTLNNGLAAVQALAVGQSLTDTFSYTNVDNHGATSNATNLVITINGTNDNPVAVADTASVKEDTNTLAQPNPVTGNVLANDTDVDNGDTHTVATVNGSAANVGNDVVGTYGTLHLNSNGSYTYTLNNSLPAVQALAEGQQVTDTFNYTSADNHGGTSNSTTLTVTVIGTNDAPVAVADAGDVKEDTTLTSTGNVLANDTDVDTNDTHTVVAVDGLAGNVGQDVVGTYGTLHINSDGSATYTLDNSKASVQALADGQTVNDVFNYTESDNHGATSTANLTITVHGTNDAPVAVADTNAITEGGSPVSGNVLANDTDVDTNDTHTVATVNGSAANVNNDVSGTYGKLHLNSDGTYSYTLNASSPLVKGLAAGQVVTDTFNYTEQDNSGAANAGSNSTTLTITITGVNNPPVITSFSNDTGVQGDHITSDTTLLLTGTADSNSTILVSDGLNLIGTALADASGNWTFATQTLSTGFHNFTAVAVDSQGNNSAASAVLTIQVDPNAADHAPTVSASNFSIAQDAHVAITSNAGPSVSATDPDGDAIVQYQFFDDNAATGTADDHPANDTSGYFTVNGVRQASGQIFTVTDLSTVQFTGGATNDILWVRATDGQQFSAWRSFNATETVHGPTLNNQPPQLQTTNLTATSRGQVFNESDFVTGAHDPNGDAILRYHFYDDHTALGSADDNPANDNSGYFTLNGVREAEGVAFEVNASDLANLQFHSTNSTNTNGGPDILWVQAFDGTDWSAWTKFTVTGVTDTAPVATATAPIENDAKNAHVALNTMFSATADTAHGASITQYEVRDLTNTEASGYFVVDGISQAGNTGAITVTAADLANAQTYFQTGTNSSDDLQVRAFDGLVWSDWASFHVNGNDQAPVIGTLAPVTIASGATEASAASIFNLPSSVSDADHDSITTYQFFDDNQATGLADDHPANDTTGYFTVDGVRQASGTTITVSASDLANVQFVKSADLSVTSEVLWVRASDGTDFSNWQKVTVTESHNAPNLTNHAPQVLVSDIDETHQPHGTSIAASTMYSSFDADHDQITRVQFWDDHQATGTADDNPVDDSSGHFVLNGHTMAEGQAIDVATSDIGSLSFVTGSGSDLLWARVFDGTTWSSWESFHVNAPVDQASTINGPASVSIAVNGSVAASIAFTASDPDTGVAGDPNTNDQIVKYQFWDGTPAANSAHFTIDGAPQATNTAIDVAAAELSHVSIVAASTAETDAMWVRAFDGTTWSSWHQFNVVTH